MDRVIALVEQAWEYLKDHPGAVLTGALMAVMVFVILKVGSFLVNIGG